MIINYLKLAMKLLWRKKFFTFINLFGISFTLMILTLLISFLDNELGSNPPMTENDRMVSLISIAKKKDFEDVSYDIDSNEVDGVMTYDTTNTHTSKYSSVSQSDPSFYLLDKYYRSVPFTEKYTFFSNNSQIDLFVHQKKLTLEALYTDAAYWEVFDFQFVEGGPYYADAIEDQQPVVVINEQSRSDYFGFNEHALGKEMIIDKKHFKVIGVIKDVTVSGSFTSGDLFFPYSHLTINSIESKEYLGEFQAVYLADYPGNVKSVQSEIKKITSTIPLPNPDEFNYMESRSETFMEGYARNLIYKSDSAESVRYFYSILSVVILLFILLPTLNLVNVNITRIMERSSEIGVRKAFGANITDLLFQFLFENVVITVIGGLIGFVFSIWAIGVINSSEIFPRTTLEFNGAVFVYGLLVTLLFGIISGFAPAWKMSRVSIINALKNK